MNFATLALLVGSASAYATMEPVEYEFMNFISKYGRSYGTKDEYAMRLATFKKNFEEIQRFNSEQSSSVHAVNKFTDLTQEEINLKHTGLLPVKSTNQTRTPSNVQRPASVDWVTAGHVNPVKDQGSCGSCWTFTVVGAVESADDIAGYGLKILSEQQLLDCNGFPQLGCSGGLQNNGFQYVENKQLELLADYPYVQVKKACSYDESKTVSHLVSHSQLTATKDANLDAIAEGPTSIAVAVNNYFVSYSSGILGDESLCGTDLNHGLVAVGYGTDSSGNGYVLAKNSWNTNWGESGYVRLGTDGDLGVCHWAAQSFSASSEE